MRPLRRTAETDAIFLAEVERRKECRTNKQLAKLTGFSPSYCAKMVSRFRHAKGQSVSVSCETVERSNNGPTEVVP